MRRLIFVAALLFATDAAADGYSKFFHPTPGATPEVVARERAAPPPETPQLLEVSDSPKAVQEAMARRGYHPVGYSNFTSGWRAKSKGALKQGKKLKADLVVVIDPQFSNSVSGSIPITTPTTQTTYHTGTATAYGPGGNVTAYGSGTSTTYGTQTSQIPYTIDRYEYGAIYFVKKKYSFGVILRPLDDAERQRLQTNSGGVVQVVVEGTPAFISDVLPGDIILSLNGTPLSTAETFGQIVKANLGRPVEVVLARGDAKLTKVVQLDP